jgi:hypothetical protein
MKTQNNRVGLKPASTAVYADKAVIGIHKNIPFEICSHVFGIKISYIEEMI